MISRFLPEARLELIEAAQYYDRRQPGLGDRFVDAIQRGVADIEEHPRRWPVLKYRVRRRLISVFPYALLYRVGREEILILAVMHLHREPNYWIARLGTE